jgi:hypothetical protein
VEGLNYFPDGSTDLSCNIPRKVNTLLGEKQFLLREKY